MVHPECAHDLVEVADRVGSTERILAWVEAVEPDSVIGVGTEIHMMQRMAAEHPDISGEVVNQIKVDERTAEWARVALERMLDIT